MNSICSQGVPHNTHVDENAFTRVLQWVMLNATPVGVGALKGPCVHTRV